MRFKILSILILIISMFSLVFSGTISVSGDIAGGVFSDDYNSYKSVLEIQAEYIGSIPSTYCSEFGGGMYSFSASPVALSWTGSYNTGSYSADLVYCKTTKDLLNMGAIPIEWVNDNLIIYCDEGKAIQDNGGIFSLGLLNELQNNVDNIYKACIVKNLDLTSTNTVIFGIYSGNTRIDTPEVSSISFSTEGLTTKYNPDSSFFYASDFLTSEYYPISYLFEANLLGIDSSRFFLGKSFPGDGVVYGFDSGSSYTIRKKDFDDDVSGMCNQALARYVDHITCGAGFISFEGPSKEMAFNLMKNIILQLKDSQLSQSEAISNGVSQSCLNSGGTPYYERGEFICRFSGEICPSGWSSSGHTTTLGVFGVDEKNADEGWEDRMLQGACFTGLHSFSSQSLDTCDATSYGEECEYKYFGFIKKLKCSKTSTTTTFEAEVVEIGCVK